MERHVGISDRALVNIALRVIKYVRRGFGQSSRHWDGYDYDTLADGLKVIIDEHHLTNDTRIGSFKYYKKGAVLMASAPFSIVN